MHGYVVFDNNAYKRVSHERLARVISAEREYSIVPLANIVVLQELLARARDVDPEQRRMNRAAIRKLGQHCSSTRDGKTIVNFLSHVESQVHRRLTGEQHHNAEAFDILGEIVGVVSEADNNDPLADISDHLDAIEQLVAKVEADYVAHLKAAAGRDIEPNQMKRNLNYAAEVAARTQTLYGRQSLPEEIVPHIIDVAKITSIGFSLRDSVIDEVRAKGGGYGQHANTVWDEQVVSSTSMYTSIGGESVLLVTEEKRLLRAAESANAADRVCAVAEYEQMLGLPMWKSPST